MTIVQTGMAMVVAASFCLNLSAGGNLIIELDAHRRITTLTSHGDMNPAVPLSECKGVDIVDVLPFTPEQATQKEAIAKAFEKAVSSEISSVAYQFGTEWFNADIEVKPDADENARYVVTVTKIQDAQPIMHAWSDKDHDYRASLSFDGGKATLANELSLDFHYKNWLATDEAIRFPASVDAFKDFATPFIWQRTDMMKAGDARLLVVHRDGRLVASAYVIEKKDNLYISCAGFTDAVVPTAIEAIQKELLGMLSSSNFPTAKKILACVGKESPLINVLHMFEFSESSEELEPGLPTDQFKTFERALTK